MLAVLVFIAGLVVGSFLNVCIYRIPKHESIVSPRSHCMSCAKTIPWYDNIPLLSYILLRGRCRFCGSPISFLYFIIELLTGLLFLLLFIHFGLSIRFFAYSVLISGLIVISFIDLKTQEIPDEITLGGMAAGLILSFISPQLMSQEGRIRGLVYSFLGVSVGAGLIYSMALLGKALFKKDAMGGGDMKLMAMLGAFLGWRLAVLTFFLAPLTGSIVGIIVKLKNKENIIPYGPHLSLAAVIAILWGEKILGWILLT